MKKIKYLIFRYLTSADYFNIYKPSGTEEGGGGQGYIDFPTKTISLDNWGKFFEGATSVLCSTGENGPAWLFPISSVGVSEYQEIKIYQRRPQSVCIASQRNTSQQANRVAAWRPERGFPKPQNPKLRDSLTGHILIFIVRTMDDEFWAGWTNDEGIKKLSNIKELFPATEEPINEGRAGFISINGAVSFDTNNVSFPLVKDGSE